MRKFAEAIFVLCVVAGLLSCSGAGGGKEAGYHPGDLDTSFGTSGRVTLSTTGRVACAAVLQPDGKIVVAGNTEDAVPDVFLTRFNADGSVDATFGTLGTVVTDLGDYDFAFGLAIQPNGMLVTVGLSGTDLALARFDEDGVLDPGFGTAGIAWTSVPGGNPWEEQWSVAVQSDGKIVVAGGGIATADNDFLVARFSAAGFLENPGFGTSGFAVVDFGVSDHATSIILQTDGKIVAAGSSEDETDSDFAVLRLTTSGAADATFGSAGRVTTEVGGSDVARAVALQSGGRILVAGASQVAGQSRMAIARYSGGSLDATFGDGGTVITGISSIAEPSSLVIQSDGKILAAGTVDGSSFALVRYSADGALDGSFGTSGIVTTLISSTSECWAAAAVLQPDGKIVVVGNDTTSGSQVTLVRYLL